MEDNAVTTTIAGEIVDLAFKWAKNNNEYAELAILEEGRQWPIKGIRAFDAELVGRLHKAQVGMWVSLGIHEREGDYQGKAITYRNLVEIRDAKTEAPASASAPAARPKAQTTETPQTPRATPTYAERAADGMAKGNAINAAGAVIAAFVSQSKGGELPTMEWLTTAMARIELGSRALLEARSIPEEEEESPPFEDTPPSDLLFDDDDDSLAVIGV